MQFSSTDHQGPEKVSALHSQSKLGLWISLPPCMAQVSSMPKINSNDKEHVFGSLSTCETSGSMLPAILKTVIFMSHVFSIHFKRRFWLQTQTQPVKTCWPGCVQEPSPWPPQIAHGNTQGIGCSCPQPPGCRQHRHWHLFLAKESSTWYPTTNGTTTARVTHPCVSPLPKITPCQNRVS